MSKQTLQEDYLLKMEEYDHLKYNNYIFLSIIIFLCLYLLSKMI